MSKNLWSLGLIKTINNPANHIIRSDVAVVIKDQYPKAKHHYLVLPLQNIHSIHNLDATHLPLLEEMYMMAINIIEVKQQNLNDFKIGFHAEPSMQRLHMHVISNDFISESLKTKRHWNSFNTNFFICYNDLIEHLERNGKFEPLEKQMIEDSIKQDLQCNQCHFKANAMPTLKKHLLKHSMQN